MHPAFKPLFGSTAYLDDAKLIEKSKDNARRKVRELLQRADAQLAMHDWIAGSRSIADPYLFVVLRWSRSHGVDLAGLDHLTRFAARMDADPGVQKALHEEGGA